ncbi:hypothetical protein PROVALCAL_02119 [Providencia alcalifaciens DSM 30120]|uniref:Uncharacterized protein n=1 Tax=Providencia alcalifaciens DSM 30120 TaxID=520999 RepID=B6XFI7_9GAMM|nr:hypothetical protein PROVALCAL_02119 [Providencia alcalifaciens DSM 30120]
MFLEALSDFRKGFFVFIDLHILLYLSIITPLFNTIIIDLINKSTLF